MLTRVVIQNFRSCQDLILDHLGAVTVLLGPNGAGKTNILRAIHKTAQFAVGTQPQDAWWPDIEGAATLEFQSDEHRYRYANSSKTIYGPVEGNARLELEESVSIAEPGGTWRQLAHRLNEGLEIEGDPSFAGMKLPIDPNAPFLVFLLAYPAVTKDKQEHFVRVERFLRRIRYCPFDEPNESNEIAGVFPTKQSDDWAARYQTSGDPGDSLVLKLMYMYRNEREKFQEILDLLGKDGLDIVRDIVIQSVILGAHQKSGENVRDNSFDYVLFLPAQSPNPEKQFWFRDLSLGTRRILRMMVSLVFDDCSVMLIEHPEDGIHRGIARQLFSRLKSYTDPAQIILTSHSELVFDMLDPSEVRLVTMVDGVTQARALGAEEVVRARRYVNEDGRFSDYLEFTHNL